MEAVSINKASPDFKEFKDFKDLKFLPEESSPEKLAQMAGSFILKSAGEDLSREGLLRTPQRFAGALKDLTSGYRMSPLEVVGKGIFKAESRGLVSVRDVEFYSLCEHHMLPFWGKANLAYYPGEKILGLSKIPRIVDLFARRFQVQERLTDQIAKSVFELINARAVIVTVSANHLCMMMRGVEKQSSYTNTEVSYGLENLNENEKERLWESLS